MKKFIKQKLGQQLGFRTPDFARAKGFGGGKSFSAGKFNPGTFKTQHKG